MRISRDKVNKVAHVVTDALAELDAVDFIEDQSLERGGDSRRVGPSEDAGPQIKTTRSSES